MPDTMTPLVAVAVDQAAFSYDKPYTYRWPADLPTPSVGLRVTVPFGNGNRRRQGIVMQVLEGAVGAGYKPVASVVDAEPLLSEEMVALDKKMRHWRIFFAIISITVTDRTA